ncbi:C40 family peptidase [Enterococcus sp. BWB1-3]|uniref:C40 family peptidase n=1 Tax=Enterococcus sp. BWB1-3 TaxID=2787713 RepID=UPI002ED46E06
MKQQTFFSQSLLFLLILAVTFAGGFSAWAEESEEKPAALSSRFDLIQEEKKAEGVKLRSLQSDKEIITEKIKEAQASITKIRLLNESLTVSQKLINQTGTKAKETATLTLLPVPASNPTKDNEETVYLNELNSLKEELAAIKEAEKEKLTEAADLLAEEKRILLELSVLEERLDKENVSSDLRSQIVSAAQKELGKPYVYGASGPNAFDCSGLVQYVFNSVGLSIGRTTVNQETAGNIISVSEAMAGDLVFWGGHGETYHVGISLGNGSFIHAPVPGDVVQVTSVSSYSPNFAVRVL